ncbi:MAG: hypothetical protein AAFP81_11985 [Pseudomonadota bacterium]
MRFKQITLLSATAFIGLGLALAASPTADASPRFTVKNDSSKKVFVDIFDGDDSVCSFPDKTKIASAGETDTYGCNGHGKGQCKVEFIANDKTICKNLNNTCSGNVAKIKNNETVRITEQDGKFTCALITG